MNLVVAVTFLSLVNVVVLGIASRRLGRLQQLGLNVPQGEALERTAKAKFRGGRLISASVPPTGNLGIDPVEALLAPHNADTPITDS